MRCRSRGRSARHGRRSRGSPLAPVGASECSARGLIRTYQPPAPPPSPPELSSPELSSPVLSSPPELSSPPALSSPEEPPSSPELLPSSPLPEDESSPPSGAGSGGGPLYTDGPNEHAQIPSAARTITKSGW